MRNRTGLAVMIFLIHLVCPAYSATLKRLDQDSCLDCADVKPNMQKCLAGSPSQTWTFSDGLVKCKGSGKCLAEYKGNVVQRECGSANNFQNWKVEKAHRLRLLKQLGHALGDGHDACLKLWPARFAACDYSEDVHWQAVYHE
jgi:hypothetical protein